jgi:putative FmdB family regulatory protein
MPTYEYKCTACGHTFEKFQSITAEPIKRCPHCGKAKAKRLISAGAGLIFKGSGFYITDYRDAGYKDKAKAESGAASGGEGAGESKGETKGDTKSEGKAEGKAASDAATKSAAGETKAAAPKPEPKSSAKSEGKSSKKKQ